MLSALAGRHSRSKNDPGCSSHTNFRYMSTPEKITHIHEMGRQNKRSKVLYSIIVLHDHVYIQYFMHVDGDYSSSR